MKFPATFAWLGGAVLTATLIVFCFTSMFSSAGANPAPPQPVTAPAPPPLNSAPPVNAATSSRIQIAFLLDTSSSMDGLIDQAKARLWNILNEILKVEKDGTTPDIEVALYQYGNSSLLPGNGYIQQVAGLTTDVDLISAKLFGLTTGGGDEYCGQVIQTSTNELQWDDNDNTIKLIYIAGNETFHQGDVKAGDALTKARARGIRVNTIFCGDPNSADGRTWAATLTSGDGDFFFINQDERVVYIPSPHDDRIEELNQQLNRTYIPIGHNGAALQANQLAQDNNAASYSKANLSSRAKFKASKKYKNTSWDLVDAEEADPQRILKEKASLPDSLSRLTDEELSLTIKRLKTNRENLQEEIKDLTRKRDRYVAEAKKAAAGAQKNTLSDKINQSVRKTLIEKEYTIKE
ncbi:VWA domain-containing protein [Neolewinella aurantiaca]|uniref:VWA domain-containing protein n=1 Tax=Neolewinella aurantiaca TaxID=2602767 RepID=A0A5C7FFM7_9BACT|nr:vWA domain-containing protein [Neolewinella aurantiaca]TXF88430.1 VWA domain-containing protein [Neolewinella aurantiaca]